VDKAYEEFHFLFLLQHFFHLQAVIPVHLAHHGVKRSQERRHLGDIGGLVHRLFEIPPGHAARALYQLSHGVYKPAAEDKRGKIKHGGDAQQEKGYERGDKVYPFESVPALLQGERVKFETRHLGIGAEIMIPPEAGKLPGAFTRAGKKTPEAFPVHGLRLSAERKDPPFRVGDENSAGPAHLLHSQFHEQIPEIYHGESVMSALHRVDQPADRQIVDELEFPQPGAAVRGRFSEQRIPGQVYVTEKPFHLRRAAAQDLASVRAGERHEQKFRIAGEGLFKVGSGYVIRARLPHIIKPPVQFVGLLADHQRGHLGDVLMQILDVALGY